MCRRRSRPGAICLWLGFCTGGPVCSDFDRWPIAAPCASGRGAGAGQKSSRDAEDQQQDRKAAHRLAGIGDRRHGREPTGWPWTKGRGEDQPAPLWLSTGPAPDDLSASGRPTPVIVDETAVRVARTAYPSSSGLDRHPQGRSTRTAGDVCDHHTRGDCCGRGAVSGAPQHRRLLAPRLRAEPGPPYQGSR